MDDQVAALLRSDLFEICIDTTFLVLGMASCAIAALRRQSGVRVFLWTGLWSAAYGLLHLLGVRAVVLALPPWLQVTAPYVNTVITYGLVVVASCAWLELTVGTMRKVVIAVAVAAAVTAVLGIGWFVVTGVDSRFMPLNNALAATILLLLLITVSSKTLFKKYLLLPNRGFLVFGTVVFTVEALFGNLARPFFGFRSPLIFDHLGFLALLAAFGYSGMKMVMSNEHRLLEIQAELEVARQIQASILPINVPQVRGLDISATYQPMASVAGDFYEFLPVDSEHAGFVVADVCGHGVPAALIASMLKVAVRSVAGCADRPGEFLQALNRVLAEPLRGQLVSASYLWVDMQLRKASYSAAGHPPMLRWNGGLERIESNGLLFGIREQVEYPACDVPLHPGDRLLLYTDGVTEAENNAGQAFGDLELQRTLAESNGQPPAELSRRIMTKIQRWQHSAEPQDDMTLIVIEVQ
jgi:phosphoserine phosphatase RsbU/P